MDVPVDRTTLILLLLDLGEEMGPHALVLPAGEAGTHGLPVAIPFRKVTPGAPGSLNPEDAVEDRAVIESGTTSPRTLWGEQWGQLAPLLIGQFITPNRTPFWRTAGLCGHSLAARRAARPEGMVDARSVVRLRTRPRSPTR